MQKDKDNGDIGARDGAQDRYAMLISLLTGVRCQTWNFPDPIKFDNACGHENLVGQWSVGGTLTLTPEEMTLFEQSVVIKTAYEVLYVFILSNILETEYMFFTSICRRRRISEFSTTSRSVTIKEQISKHQRHRHKIHESKP